MQSIGTCFIYQKPEKDDKCRSTNDGHKHLSTIQPKFQKNNGLPFCLDELKGNYDTLENALIKEAKYHKKCYNDYREEQLKRAKERRNKSNVASDTSEQLCSPSQSTRSRDNSKHDFGKLVCCFCSETDTENNLTAADTFHATKNKVDINHASNLTKKWKTMVAKLDYSELLSRLSSGDIVSDELYYHKSTIKNCYVQFCSEYKRTSKTSDEDKANNK